MADTNTNKLGLTKPEVGGSGDTWGEKLNLDMEIIDSAVFSHHFAEDSANHDGLNFAFKSGVVRAGNSVIKANEGSILLTDNSDNFIEVEPITGEVLANTTGFSVEGIPLYIVTTLNGAITEMDDKRAFLVKATPQNTQWFLTYGGEEAESTSAYLTKGAVYEPSTDIKCYGFGMLNSDANTQSLKLRIFELNGTTQVGTALAESDVLTGQGEQTFLNFEFNTPIVLNAGTRYIIAISNITSGATLVKVGYAAHPSNNITGFRRNTYAYVNNANPADGTTWTIANAPPYVSGIKILI